MIPVRRWTKRLAVITTALTTMLAGLLFVSTPTAQADGCKAKLICGRAYNDTSRTMKIAVINENGDKRCGPVWDWWNEKWSTDDKSKEKGEKGTTACSTKTLQSGQVSTVFDFDVDAFTYDRKFWFMGKEYSGETWVKFTTGLSVICRKLNPIGDSMPRCYLGTF
ncbi:MAG: hypothetical protein ACRDTD_04560 [Pseudonocardiaceae bacterium]